MLNFWISVAKEQQAQAHAQQQQPRPTQQAAQPLAEKQQPQISAKIATTADAVKREADLQESVNALIKEKELPLSPLSPLSEAEEEQSTGRITNPRIVDVLQSSSKLQKLYKELLARKKIGHKMNSNEVRLLCDGAINMYRKEGLELSLSQCKELGRQELCPHGRNFWCRKVGSNCIYNRIRTLSRTPEQRERRFQLPNLKDFDKWGNRVVKNLLYYQTNYILLFLVIYALMIVCNPTKIIIGLIVQALISAVIWQCFSSKSKPSFIKWYILAGALLGRYLFLHLISAVLLTAFTLLLPISVTFIHASLRLRNMKNKLANTIESFGPSTPMSALLDALNVRAEGVIN
ncbi:GL10669 [Drosophila persimilis]|uniref:GL10669 n=1 Tax=Drosophila persimilis TaxID=7234 RepID=B4GAQ0_DROPE|nr:GL10669 [Drosophila persimilis]